MWEVSYRKTNALREDVRGIGFRLVLGSISEEIAGHTRRP
ncbi:hypothetical protein BN903_44 [Halorubrum sp. AJ67]|nr:hypothetical protein BN903_44 [Halorubrum sp. AJ67]